MKLYQQLTIFVLGSTAIPMVIGLGILRHSEVQLRSKVMAAREAAIAKLSDSVERDVREWLERINAALGYVHLSETTRDERTGLLGVVYKQSEDVIQVALVGQDRVTVATGVYLSDPKAFPEYINRVAVTQEQHSEFLSRAPLSQARRASGGSAVLSINVNEDQSDCRLQVTVPVDLPESDSRWYLLVELSLDRIRRRLRELSDARGWTISLQEETGQRIMGEGPPVVGLLKGVSDLPRTWLDGESIRATAKIRTPGWVVSMVEPMAGAFGEIRQARLVTMVGTGFSIAALLAMGALFTRRIARNLKLLSTGAEAYSKGELHARVSIHSRDEMGLLADTFNRMGEQLEASRMEIEAWNRELSARVDERTRELEIAHRRLLETSKLAAIGQLGAGVAHEINNPLVGILGNVQLLLAKGELPEREQQVLKKIETGACRCRDVTRNLLRFSEQDSEPVHLPLELEQVIHDAFSLTEQRFMQQGIRVEWHLAPLPLVLGDGRQLMQVFLNLFDNARVAMRDGGVLTISGQLVEAATRYVEIAVRDTGKGIPVEDLSRLFEPFFTTKDEWTNTGLGLSVVYRIIADHGGKIDVVSEPGSGSEFRVSLLAVEEEA